MATAATAAPTLSPHAGRGRRAFTLVELLVVLFIVVILTSLLMPGLRSVRESANRLSCASNMRQIGYALTCYATDYADALPFSYFGSADIKMPQEMMAATTGGTEGVFEGIGRLLPHCGCYLDSPSCLYCPSHHGEHTLERYEASLAKPFGNERAFTNYHYRGDADPESGKRYTLTNDHSFLMLSDGLRTKSDFNHENGLNLLHGDLAVSWLADVDGSILNQLPDSPNYSNALFPLFDEIWEKLDKDSVE